MCHDDRYGVERQIEESWSLNRAVTYSVNSE